MPPPACGPPVESTLPPEGSAAVVPPEAAAEPPSAIERPKVVARCDLQFVPRCNHRHALVRSSCAGTAAVDDEPLVCDGGCGTEIPRGDARWSCYPCDYDVCELCLVSRSGAAVYIGLLKQEEERTSRAEGRLTSAEDRARVAEQALTRKAREERTAVSAASEKRAADAKISAAEERAKTALERVAVLETEVVERRQRSKANLEKMYAAQKERDGLRAELAAKDAACDERVAIEQSAADELRRQLTSTVRELGTYHGDVDALHSLSLEEAESLEERTRAGLLALGARRAALAAEEASERQKRLDCAVCLVGARGIAFAPCGHIATCKECAPKVAECPLCKCVIAQRVAVFLP